MPIRMVVPVPVWLTAVVPMIVTAVPVPAPSLLNT